MEKIRIAIAGVGNCASSLLQGFEYYSSCDPGSAAGLLHHEVGGYGLGDIEVVAAFDIDRRKVSIAHSRKPSSLPPTARQFSTGSFPTTASPCK